MRGWFAVADAASIKREGPTVIEDRLGLSLVAWRDESSVHVADRFCPHLGADLSMGEMRGDNLRCAFHGWQFDGDGKVAHIPYCEKLNHAADLRMYLSQERFGRVWIWTDATAEPFDFPPTIMESDDDWSEWHVNEVCTRTNISDAIENGVDSGHFNELHEQPSMLIKSYDLAPGDPYGHVVLDYTGIDTIIDINYFGPGLATLQFIGIIDMTLHVTYTPSSDGGTHMRFGFWFKGEVDEGLARYLIKEITYQFDQDVAIWDRKAYPAVPKLCRSDGPIMEMRRWVGAFG